MKRVRRIQGQGKIKDVGLQKLASTAQRCERVA